MRWHLWLLGALLLRAAPVRAEPHVDGARAAADWTGRSALVQTRGHGQVALLGESRVGVRDRLQIGWHTLGELAPHASLLYRAVERANAQLSLRLGASYPTPFLKLFTGSGALALLPGDTTPPQAVIFDPGARVSLPLPHDQLLTFELALQLAARPAHSDSPLLDFPFLYPRFASLHAPLTARFAATAEGRIAWSLLWVGSFDAWILPVVHHGYALEPRVGAAWAFRRRVTLELGERLSYARYPVGVRFHATPYLDLRVRF